MHRSYRYILGAAIGLLVGAAAPLPSAEDASTEHAQTERHIANAMAGIDASLRQANQPNILESECDPEKPNRKSDLCAQWKAADAAGDAARYGWWQLTLGWIGLALGGVTMGAAIAAATYAKRAAVATEDTVQLAREASEGSMEALAIAARNADSAAIQVAVTQDTAKRQLRAYLSIEGAHVTGFMTDGSPMFWIHVVNRGNTPAHNVICRSTVVLGGYDPNLLRMKFEQNCHKRGTILNPGQSISERVDVEGKIPRHLLNVDIGRVLSGEWNVAFASVVSYTDTFGSLRRTTVKAWLNQRVCTDGNAMLSICSKGNRAS